MYETYKRKSYAAIGPIYYWTATIHKWNHLFSLESNKRIVIDYLRKLSEEKLVTIYAFVLMPNHIHLIWRQNRLNGKETPFGSFLKFTAHKLLSELKRNGLENNFEVNLSNKRFEIWQRDSLSVEISSRAVAKQKIDYIHANPVTGIWRLAKDDVHYYYSSAKFYETGIDDFGFLNDLFLYFDGE